MPSSERPSIPLLLGVFLAALIAPLTTAAPRPFSPEDLVTLERLSDPQVSPDGRRVAYVLRSTDMENNRGRTKLWYLDLKSGRSRQLTTHPAGVSNPRWSADGKSLYFLSSRSDLNQVWQLPLDGGEARQVTDLPLDAGILVLSPDGRHLAVSMEVFVDCETLQCTTERLAAQAAEPASGKLFENLFVRHWDTWKDGRRSHLFVLPLTPQGAGTPVDITSGLDADVPSKPFGGPEEITFTPRGEGVVFTARDVGAEEAWSTNFDLFYAPVDGSASPKGLTDNPAWDTQPVFSPDGASLAYLAMERPRFEADRLRIVLRPWRADNTVGAARVLTENWDRSAGGIFFSADGKTIYATAGDVGNVGLFAINTANGMVSKLVGNGHVRSPAVVGDQLIFGRDDLRSPVDLYSVHSDGSHLKRLTEINKAALDGVLFGDYEQFNFAGWNGETVHGYTVKPADFKAGRKYPVAFLIHGGPQGSFDNDFHFRWNPQTYAGAGFAVVMIDFHGSTGYGQAFTDSIRDDWGGKPLEDLQKGLAAAIERNPWLDSDRVCALGASYGGYMVNWIAGNWPDRFRCLVNHDGLFDLRSMYYSTEELWFPEWEFRGTPWQNPNAFKRNNPAEFVGNWKTPMLVVHGADDFRVVETQGLATFTALKRRGIPSQLLYYPDENHWVLKPKNSLQWHQVVAAWLNRWTAE
jgi:dipeptidyl aminopeptidase/acylaminoacyl peptidase